MDPSLFPGAPPRALGVLSRNPYGLPFAIELGSDFRGSLSNDQMRHVFIHEGIHTVSGEGVFRSMDYNSWHYAHGDAYNRAVDDADR
jgi:hypothetical protein